VTMSWRSMSSDISPASRGARVRARCAPRLPSGNAADAPRTMPDQAGLCSARRRRI
jgi:hypothetical protein